MTLMFHVKASELKKQQEHAQGDQLHQNTIYNIHVYSLMYVCAVGLITIPMQLDTIVLILVYFGEFTLSNK